MSPVNAPGSLHAVRTPGNPAWSARRHGLTLGVAKPSIRTLMSATVPEVLDAWRMVAAGRILEGEAALAGLERLRPSLAEDAGRVHFSMAFGREPLQGFAHIDLRIETTLMLTCQRRLVPFAFPVAIEQRYGLLRHEEDAAGLPADVEPWLLGEDGALRPLDLVEDELILALPLIPVAPGSEAMARDWPPQDGAAAERPHPFAALAALKPRGSGA